jgi:hypothetical protein
MQRQPAPIRQRVEPRQRPLGMPMDGDATGGLGRALALVDREAMRPGFAFTIPRDPVNPV